MRVRFRDRDGKLQTAFAAFLINGSIAFFAFLYFSFKIMGEFRLSL